jgi:hypothetical protein
MITRKRSIASLVALVCAYGASANALAKDTFEMGSYSNWAGGARIDSGDYAGAIAAASHPSMKGDTTSMLGAATNLCVAYTVSRELALARKACDEAVSLAKRVDDSDWKRLRRESATASALSNRGVLRALSGDSVGAASDFRAAIKLRSSNEMPSRNLAYLESSPAHRLALASAAAAGDLR